MKKLLYALPLTLLILAGCAPDLTLSGNINLNDLLTQAAKLFNTTAQIAYETLMKQVQYLAARDTVIAVIFLALGILLVRLAVVCWREYKKQDDDDYIGIMFLPSAGAGICLAVVILNVVAVLQDVINPNYVAIQLLLQMIGGK